MPNSASQVPDSSYSPEPVLSKDEYWQQFKAENYSGVVHPAAHYNDWNYRIAKFFGSGPENRFESAYENYLNNVNNRNEQKATQSARAWDEYMSNTAYSRAFEDLQRAGINPYLLLNNGSAPATATGSAHKPNYKSSSSTPDSKSNTKGRDFALILLAIARLAAAL